MSRRRGPLKTELNLHKLCEKLMYAIDVVVGIRMHSAPACDGQLEPGEFDTSAAVAMGEARVRE